MPIYEYKCEQCGEQLETMQRMSDPPLTECPRCGGTLRKQISAPAFQFKGSGWYVTDYARKGGGGGGKEAKDSGGAAEKAGDKGQGGEAAAKPAASGSGSSDSSGGSSGSAKGSSGSSGSSGD
ncbi:MAG TPA: FmdB family zinc ribbon protein [Thermoanaerobaculia bacterium]|nr:FmdB family zinc ribbon protein [Thermoanaerobaculia bacterium]